MNSSSPSVTAGRAAGSGAARFRPLPLGRVHQHEGGPPGPAATGFGRGSPPAGLAGRRRNIADWRLGRTGGCPDSGRFADLLWTSGLLSPGGGR